MKKIIILISILFSFNVYALELSCPTDTKLYNEYFKCNIIDKNYNEYKSFTGNISSTDNINCELSNANENLTKSFEGNTFNLNGKSSNEYLLEIICHVTNNVKSNTELVSINDLKYNIDNKNNNIILKSDYIKISTSDIDTKPRDTSDKNSLLESLNLGLTDVDFTFSRFVTEYNFEVLNEVESFSPSYIALNKDAIITVKGSKKLDIGKNTFDIYVKSPISNATTCYTITINRLPKGVKIYDKSADVSLSKIIIKDKDIKFNNETKNYNIKLKSNENSLDIYVKPNYDGAKVKISDTNNLNNKDVITITITSENGEITDKYFLHIIKEIDKSYLKTYVILGIVGLIIIGALIYIFILNSKDKKVVDELDAMDI